MIDLNRGLLFNHQDELIGALHAHYDDFSEIYKKNNYRISVNPYMKNMLYVSRIRGESISGVDLLASIKFVDDRINNIAFQIESDNSDTWDNVGIDLMESEYKILVDSFSMLTERQPDFKRGRNCCGWNFPWGRLTIFWEEKSFSCTATMSL